MLRNHPFVQRIRIEDAFSMDGTPEKVLVVEARLRWSPHRNSNDNALMADLSRQISELERMARTGIFEYARVELRPADLN